MARRGFFFRRRHKKSWYPSLAGWSYENGWGHNKSCVRHHGVLMCNIIHRTQLLIFNVHLWKEVNTKKRPKMVCISCLEEIVAEAYTFYHMTWVLINQWKRLSLVYRRTQNADSGGWYGVGAGSYSFFCHWGLWCPLTPYVVPIILPHSGHKNCTDFQKQTSGPIVKPSVWITVIGHFRKFAISRIQFSARVS